MAWINQSCNLSELNGSLEDIGMRGLSEIGPGVESDPPPFIKTISCVEHVSFCLNAFNCNGLCEGNTGLRLTMTCPEFNYIKDCYFLESSGVKHHLEIPLTAKHHSTTWSEL